MAKVVTSVTVDPELKRQAKKMGIELSKTLDEGLRQKIASVKTDPERMEADIKEQEIELNQQKEELASIKKARETAAENPLVIEKVNIVANKYFKEGSEKTLDGEDLKKRNHQLVLDKNIYISFEAFSDMVDEKIEELNREDYVKNGGVNNGEFQGDPVES